MPEKNCFETKKGTQPIPQSSTQHLTNHMLFLEELKGQVHAYNKVCCTLPSNYWNSWTTLLQSTSNGTALFFMVTSGKLDGRSLAAVKFGKKTPPTSQMLF